MAAVRCVNFEFGCPCDSQDGNPESYCCADCVFQPCLTRKHTFRAQPFAADSKNRGAGSSSGVATTGGGGVKTPSAGPKEFPSLTSSTPSQAALPLQRAAQPTSSRSTKSPLLHSQAEKLITMSFPGLKFGSGALSKMSVEELARLPGIALQELLPWPAATSAQSLTKVFQLAADDQRNSGTGSVEPVGVLIQRSINQDDLMVITRDPAGVVRLCTATHNHEYGNPILVLDRLRQTLPIVARCWVLRQGSIEGSYQRPSAAAVCNSPSAALSPLTAKKPGTAGDFPATAAGTQIGFTGSSVPCFNRLNGCPCDSLDGNPNSYCCEDCVFGPCTMRLHYQAPPQVVETERTPPMEEDLPLIGNNPSKNITGIELPVPPQGMNLKELTNRIQQIQIMEKEHAALVAPASAGPLDPKVAATALEKKREIIRLKLNLEKEMSEWSGRFKVFLSEAEKTEKELTNARGCEDLLEPRWNATREVVERRYRETKDALTEAKRRVDLEKSRFHSWNAVRARAAASSAVPKKKSSAKDSTTEQDQLATLFGGYFQFVFAGEIQPGKQKLECGICADIFLQEDRFYADCCTEKIMCRACALRHIQTELEKCSTIIHCPWIGDCTATWPKSKCTEVMSEREIGQWDRVEWRQTSQAAGAVICRAADCRGMLFEDDLVFQAEPHHFMCPVKPGDPDHEWCLACDAPWHEGSTCEKYQQWRQANNNAEAATREALRIMGAKECHQCHNFVEKKELCNHMTCLCGAHFCNVCGEKLDPKDLNAHYGVQGKPCYGKLFAGMYDDIQ